MNPANNNYNRLQSLCARSDFFAALLLIVCIMPLPCHGEDGTLLPQANAAEGASAVSELPVPEVKVDSNDLPAWRSSIYVTWTSDYVYRGVSLTESNPTWQGGADIAHRSGLFGGVWTSAIDFSPPVGPNTEHNVFAGYSHDFGMAWSGSIRYTRFDFRGGSVGPDNAFNQWQVDLQYNRATTLRVYHADNTYGMRFASTTYELQHVVPIADNWLLSGLFGRWDDLETLGVDHYNYVEFSGSWSVRRFNVTAQYHHADSRGRTVYQDAAKPGWLLSTTYRIF